MSSCKTAIMSSKLYLACDASKKKKILAALADPINVDLVEQRDEDIGDEYKQTQPKDTDVKQSDSEDKSQETAETAPGSNPKAIRPSGSSGSLFDKHKDELLEEDDEWDPDSTSGTSDESDTDTVVENSVKMNSKQKVTADTLVTNPTIGINNTIINTAHEVKGLLNAKGDTAGVARVNVKNDELWVYYSDDINLNNVMTPAIDSLNAACYSNLVFNRLARTENAIVFTITVCDTGAPVQPATTNEQ